jgi:hypothetical protein
MFRKTICIAENLTKILQCKTQTLDEHQVSFINRFYIKNDAIYYERPVPFGTKIVFSEDLDIKEFNKLHRIANPSSIQH